MVKRRGRRIPTPKKIGGFITLPLMLAALGALSKLRQAKKVGGGIRRRTTTRRKYYK
jgi:hypothetical protein